jgi:hypothetical protein
VPGPEAARDADADSDVRSVLRAGLAAFGRRRTALWIVVLTAGVVNGAVTEAAVRSVGGDRVDRTADIIPGTDAVVGLSVSTLVAVALVAVVTLVLAGFLIDALALEGVDEADREPRGLPELLRTAWPRVGRFAFWAVLVGVVQSLGVILCVFPGVVVTFALVLWPFFVLDPDRDPPRNPLAPATRAAADHLGTFLPVFAVLVIVILAAGGLRLALLPVPWVGSVVGAVALLAARSYAACVWAGVYRRLAG